LGTRRTPALPLGFPRGCRWVIYHLLGPQIQPQRFLAFSSARAWCVYGSARGQRGAALLRFDHPPEGLRCCAAMGCSLKKAWQLGFATEPPFAQLPVFVFAFPAANEIRILLVMVARELLVLDPLHAGIVRRFGGHGRNSSF